MFPVQKYFFCCTMKFFFWCTMKFHPQPESQIDSRKGLHTYIVALCHLAELCSLPQTATSEGVLNVLLRVRNRRRKPVCILMKTSNGQTPGFTIVRPVWPAG